MYDRFNIYINQDILEYSRLNYTKIKTLNDKLVSLKKTYDLSIKLIFNNYAIMELDRVANKAYIMISILRVKH